MLRIGKCSKVNGVRIETTQSVCVCCCYEPIPFKVRLTLVKQFASASKRRCKTH